MNPMSYVFIFACLAAPSLAAWGNQGSWAQAPAPANIALSQDGRNVLDTPEVSQARSAHLAAVAAAQASAGNSNDDGSYDPRWESESNYQGNPQQWNAAPAQQQWNAAPAQQQWSAAPAQQQWNAAPAQQQWNAAPAQQQWNAAPKDWRNAPANIALSADGKYVLDTPEVAQARAQHLAAYANLPTAAPAAAQWNAAPAQQQWNAAPAPQWNSAAAAPAWNAPAPAWNSAAPAWNAAPAAPAWNAAAPAPVADTPEVQQAKAAHAAAVAAAQAAAAPAHRNW